ncbi:MAG TPA: hypothetical protein VLG66_06200 [Alphaproteobacteria bacterium]|nr:hypothetical protein [Alphaproteobacteria bacterium]
MTRLLVLIIALVVAVAVGGAAFLALTDIPAPTQRIEKVVPSDKLPR